MLDTATRTEAILAARATLACRPVYLDTETTGLEATDEIVEICILDDTGQVLINSLVKPTRPIPQGATRIHGITNAMVARAPAWPDLWPAVRAAIEGRPVAIYNAEFDVRMLKQSHRQHRLKWEPHALADFCIMLLYARFRGEWNTYRRDFRWHKLSVAGEQCHLALPNAHRAHADTLLARAVLHHVAGCSR